MPSPELANKLRVKIIGVGTAGCIMVDQLCREEFIGSNFACVNTDNSAPVTATRQVLLEAKTLRGLGTGGDPDRGTALAEEHADQLKELCADTDVVFLMAGLGGGTGGGVTPVLARAARAAGALVLAFVTLPFDCEGNRRHQLAQQALEQLQSVCDGVLCLPNQKAFYLLAPNVGFVEAFRGTTRLLMDGLGGMWRLLARRGMIEIHFEELRSVLRERHAESAFASFEASGPERAATILAALPAHPLLDGGKALEQAASIVISICGGNDLGMSEVNQLMEQISARAPQARVIMGATVDEQFADSLSATIVATPPRPPEAEADSKEADSPETAMEFTSELIHPTESKRPKARVVPPAPELTPEQRNQIITKQTGKSVRARRNAGPRMRQTTLPLDIVNKGRFDKSEPTIHKGEDLDLPTYVRRGISLN